MIFKKRFSNQENLKLTLFPNFIGRTLSGDLCPCNRLLSYRNVKYSVWFCLLFKIIFTSVAKTTINCFMGALHRFPGKHFIFSNWTSPNLVLFFKGMARCGQWCHRNRGKRGQGEKLGRHGWEPSPSTLTRPSYWQHLSGKSLFTGRMEPFSEKDCLNCLRKSSMQSTDF